MINEVQQIRIIPYIVNGEENINLPAADIALAKHAVEQMKIESKKDRLYENYDKWLKLETMSMYCIVVDPITNKPIMVSGAQHMSNNCCRLFSRYYLFDAYRTKHTDNLYSKVDNFTTDMYMLEQLADKYKLFFWSRDKGTRFFKRIKSARNDVFKKWTVHYKPIEILWEGNVQGIIYTGDFTYINELTVNK
tara:strand:- start:403 stop:978 length:576 start_codon:yes stop_codon:yes gene_type:complete